MTKSEKRSARKAARAEGRPLADELALDDRNGGPVEFTETPRGRDALHRWAKWYDTLNGAPEGPEDY